MEQLQGFVNAPTTAAFGGYIQLDYVSIDAVDTANMTHNIVDGRFYGGIPLLPNRSWLTMPAVENAPRSWEVTQQDTKHDDRYTATAGGMLKGTDAVTIKELNRMKKRFFVVLATRPDGTRILLADPVFPAKFDFSVDGGGEGLQRSRTKFKFTGKNNYGYAQW